MSRIYKFLQLSWRDQLLLIHATLMLAVVVWGLKIFPWLTLQPQLLKAANWYSQFAPTPRPSAQHLAWAIRIASLCVPRATCLPRALAAQLLLVQRAYPADLQIGVARTEDGKLEAHAWVTSENGIIIGNVYDLDHFVPLSSQAR
jgi:transglutaminase superfamily protein